MFHLLQQREKYSKGVVPAVANSAIHETPTPRLLHPLIQDEVIAKARAYLDSAMITRLFAENPIAA